MTLKARILVVDDEPGILRFLRVALVANDFEFESARSVQEALRSIAINAPDVVVLDLGLPDGDGKDIICHVREWSAVPIIIISARDREAEKIAALDLGADDCIAKPFRVGELMARIRVALRNRVQRRSELPAVRVADIEIDHVRHHVKRAGKEIRLTPKEFELLAFLAQNAGTVVSHGQILTAIWGGQRSAAPIKNDIGSDRDPKSVIAHKGNICENPNDRKHQYKEREHSCRTHCASPLRCYERSNDAARGLGHRSG